MGAMQSLVGVDVAYTGDERLIAQERREWAGRAWGDSRGAAHLEVNQEGALVERKDEVLAPSGDVVDRLTLNSSTEGRHGRLGQVPRAAQTPAPHPPPR